MGLSLYTEHQLDLSIALPITKIAPLQPIQLRDQLASVWIPERLRWFRSQRGQATRRSSSSLPATIRLSGDEAPRSRYSSRPILSAAGSSANFNEPLFRQTNLYPVTGGFKAFYTDFLFRSNLRSAESALMSTGQPAKRVFFSGDNYALSLNPVGLTGPFEELTALRTATGRSPRARLLEPRSPMAPTRDRSETRATSRACHASCPSLEPWRDYHEGDREPGASKSSRSRTTMASPAADGFDARKRKCLITNCYSHIDLSAKTFLGLAHRQPARCHGHQPFGRHRLARC